MYLRHKMSSLGGHMDSDILGRQLRRARERRDLSQERVAADFGVCTKTVSRREIGRCRPRIDMLQELARYYGVTLNWLVYGSDLGAAAAAPMKRASVA